MIKSPFGPLGLNPYNPLPQSCPRGSFKMQNLVILFLCLKIVHLDFLVSEEDLQSLTYKSQIHFSLLSPSCPSIQS